MIETRPDRFAQLARTCPLAESRTRPRAFARPGLPLLVLPVGAVILAALAGGCVDMSDPELLNQYTVATTEGFRCADSLDKEPEDLLLHFIDVGQADAIWIQTADDDDDGNGEEEGLNILVDTGRTPLDDSPGTGRFIIDYMGAHGAPRGSTIDWMIVTHAHSDHYGGAVELMEAFDVVNIVDPGFDNSGNSTYLAFLSRAESEVSENGGQLYRPMIGTLASQEYAKLDIFGDEIEVIVLNSESELRHGDTLGDQLNNTSIALALEYADVSILLMADVYSEVEAEIIEALPDLRANILKVGHHGSTSSTSQAFLEQIFEGVPSTERYAVIQSGRRSFAGVTLPANTTVNRLLEFVPARAFFSTQFGDEDLSEAEAPGDDNVQARIRADGDTTVCYVPPLEYLQ